MADDVASELNAAWDIEAIPDHDDLYMRIHRMWVDASTGGATPGAFKIRKGETGMSTDWSKYSTPEQSRQRAKNPEENAIIGLPVGDVRHIPGLEVQHIPIPNNQAHAEVVGKIEDVEVRLRLRRLSRILIRLELE